jgi:uncharacterized cupin superfamily protein
VRRVNLFTADPPLDPTDPPGYEAGQLRLGPEIGGDKLAGGLYEVPPGQSVCPYHYELGDEEWLLVLAGTVVARHPGGEDELSAGELVCFPAGPEGAHKVTNRTGETARVVIVSTRFMPAVCVYPDSDKVGVFTEGRHDDGMFRREDSVGYYEREPR